MKKLIHRRMLLADLFEQFRAKSQKMSEEMALFGIDCLDDHPELAKSLGCVGKENNVTDREMDELVDRLNEIAAEPDGSTTIAITEQAANQFRAILTAENKMGWNLRLGLCDDGCCSAQHFLDYSQKAKTTDAVFESHGIQIHVDQKSLPSLLGTVIDYVQGTGFKVSNPSATPCGGCHHHSCGCSEET